MFGKPAKRASRHKDDRTHSLRVCVCVVKVFSINYDVKRALHAVYRRHRFYVVRIRLPSRKAFATDEAQCAPYIEDTLLNVRMSACLALASYGVFVCVSVCVLCWFNIVPPGSDTISRPKCWQSSGRNRYATKDSADMQLYAKRACNVFSFLARRRRWVFAGNMYN